MAQVTTTRALPNGAQGPVGVPRGRRDWVAVTLGLGTTALSVASTFYYLKQHLILGFQDSYSHLEISRRVVTGLSPGVAQLGGVWLPVPATDAGPVPAGVTPSTAPGWLARWSRWSAMSR